MLLLKIKILKDSIGLIYKMPSRQNTQTKTTAQLQNTQSVPRFIIRTMQTDLARLANKKIEQITIQPKIQNIQIKQERPKKNQTQAPKPLVSKTLIAPEKPQKNTLSTLEQKLKPKNDEIDQLQYKLKQQNQETILLKQSLAEQQAMQISESQALQTKIKELEQKSAQANAQNKRLQTDLNTKNADLQKIQQENMSIKNKFSQFEQEKNQLNEQFTNLQAQKTKSDNTITQLQTQNNQLKQSLEQKPEPKTPTIAQAPTKQELPPQPQIQPKPELQFQHHKQASMIPATKSSETQEITAKPIKKSFRISRQKIILGSIIFILLISFSVLVYFILKSPAQPKEPKPIIPPETQEPQVPIIETETPKSLIPVEKTLILEIQQDIEVIGQIKNFLEQNQPLPRINQLIFKKSGKFIDLKELLSSLKISIPLRIKDNLREQYTLLAFIQDNNYQLGFVLQTKNTLPVLAELSFWQKNMIYDLKALFISNNIPETDKFLINHRESPNNRIHFQDTADLSNSMHYAMIKNNLIITPSQNSLRAVLNALLSQ